MTPMLASLFVVHRRRLKVVCVTAVVLERLLRVAERGDVIGENVLLTGHRPDTNVEALQDNRRVESRVTGGSSLPAGPGRRPVRRSLLHSHRFGQLI